MKREEDEIKKIIDESYSGIKVPEGLEQRLSSKIDTWASEAEDAPETKMKPIRFTRNFWVRTLSVAASLAILITGTFLMVPKQTHNPVMIADTCTSVEDAYSEAQYALTCISKAFGKGMGAIEETTGTFSKTVSAANKYVVITEK